jgi:hypothetical protein
LLSINGGYSILELGQEQTPLTNFSVGTANGEGRLDQHINFIAAVSYFLTDWMSVGVTDGFDYHLTNAQDVSGAATPTNLSYIRNQTIVLASVLY